MSFMCRFIAFPQTFLLPVGIVMMVAGDENHMKRNVPRTCVYVYVCVVWCGMRASMYFCIKITSTYLLFANF